MVDEGGGWGGGGGWLRGGREGEHCLEKRERTASSARPRGRGARAQISQLYDVTSITPPPPPPGPHWHRKQLREGEAEISGTEERYKVCMGVWGVGEFAGLTVRAFRGVPSEQEITCSGQTLTPDADLLTLVLYEERHGGQVFVASLNLNSGECTTSKYFSSCIKSRRNSHDSSVKSLVSGLSENEVRSYACDVTTFKSGDRTQITTWSLKVTGLRT